MEEIEAPTEHLHEEINEHAKKESNWSLYVAISTALMAVFASIASLMAGHDSNEALIEQIKASDQWAYYQAKGIKQEIANLSNERDTAKTWKYKKEQAEIKKRAEEEENSSKSLLNEHVVLARSVTLFQVAIAISAISIITKRKALWYLALLIAVGGLFFFCHMYWF
jgi:alpha-galactosidase/6-phospho-beta-glucosidase family protein